jgi:hypothetical protein
MGLDEYKPGTAENRWPIAVTLVLARAVPSLLPPRFSLGPGRLVPAVETLLLVALVAADRLRQVRPERADPLGKAHDHVAGLLGRPCPVRRPGHPQDVDPPRRYPHHEQIRRTVASLMW